MKITIIGAGAIGGVIGAYLIKGGEDATFVDVAKEHVREMKHNGLTIRENDRSFNVPVEAYTLDEFVNSNENSEAVFLCVKAQHTRQAVKRIKPMLGPNSFVVSFQNGLCERVIAEEIGENRTVGCFVNLFADYIKPGLIQYGGVGSVYLGEINGTISPRIKELVERLKPWGTAKATDNISGYLWGKLSYGAVLTATALTNETIADVLESEQNRDMLLDLAAEILAVAHGKNISPIGFDDWEPSLMYPKRDRDSDVIAAQFDQLTQRLRAYTKTRTGIWRDLAVRKRKTEVPEHLSPIIKDGEAIGIDMTLTKAILSMIVEIENGEREMSTGNLTWLREIHQNKVIHT